MAAKAISALILGAFALSGAECGKSTEDPTKEKPGPDAPIVQLEGIDTGALTQREKKEWSSYVSEFLSPCQSVPVSIAQCVKDKRDCDKCAPAAKFVMKGVKDGMSREQVEKSYKNRFDPAMIKNVPVDGSPSKGPENAPITFVEFADFQCPHCGETAPLLEKMFESRKNDVRFVFKFYVLGKFPNSENAARAAIAAGKQGKFWEMHKLIFANQSRLDQAGLDALAKQLDLNVERLHADMQLPETQERINKDHKLGEDLKLEGTPTIYINGRHFDGRQDMDEWLNLELQMIGKQPTPASSAPPSDAGAAKAADAGKDAAPAPAPGDAGKR
ncbi:MAG: thioredoxin domain-containing protein [Labilithrix sp.]|nr:thioredoxin domain-containing protein [Labilithrix sp.]MCW5810039.1 thioredoxin domain-containing protein [Labilithrix sp.]